VIRGDPVLPWRPMRDAPRDGRRIICWNSAVGIYVTAYTTRWTGLPDEKPYEGFPCGFWPMAPTGYPFGQWDCAPYAWMPSPDDPEFDAPKPDQKEA